MIELDRRFHELRALARAKGANLTPCAGRAGDWFYLLTKVGLEPRHFSTLSAAERAIEQLPQEDEHAAQKT